LEEVIVLGRGEMRQSQSITAQQIEYLPPGTSPLKAIDRLPGVNFQSTDPYGAYEWSTRITVRGFNQNRLGFTLDGVPLGDMTYGNHNGLHISRAIPTELVGRTVLSQGTGSIDTASLSNLGGAVEFFSASPEQEVGATVAQTFGSDSARRTFARFDSGELGTAPAPSPVVDSSTDKWKGGGTQEDTDVHLEGCAAGWRRNVDRLLRLLGSRRDRLSGSVEEHRGAARCGLGQLLPGLERGDADGEWLRGKRRQRCDRVRRRVLECFGPAQGSSRATSRSICRSARHCSGRRRLTGITTAGRACGARRTCRRRAAHRFPCARPSIT
jgi:hypothetical protein